MRLCLLLAIWGCMVSSVMRILSGTTITTLSLMMFTQVQGTWLIHSVFINCSEKMTYLYFSWHILTVFVVILLISVITQQTRTDIKEHLEPKHTNQTPTVATISDGISDAYRGLTVLEQDKHVKHIYKSEHLTDDKIVDLNSSFESLPTQILSMKSDGCERMSPLEEFNTLHRNKEGVRKSIKIKESSIV